MTHVVETATRFFHAKPEIAAARAELTERIRELRFHRALRRQWEQVRAESSIQWAIASGLSDGARMDADALRRAVASGGFTGLDSPDERWVVGTWRAHSEAVTLMSDLGARRDSPLPPVPALLARIHRDVVAGVDGGAAGGPAMVRREAAPELLDLITTLIDTAPGTALVNLAIMHAQIVTGELFDTANAAVARVLGRLIAQRSGLDPTGCANGALWEAENPGRYASALAGYASGEEAGVTNWICEYAQGWIYGAQAGCADARRVLAGKTSV